MKNIEIIGKFEGERFRFDNPDGSSVVIGSIRLANGSREAVEKYGIDPREQLAIKGEADRTDLVFRNSYRFLGHFANYTNRRTGQTEKQFHFRTFVPHVPHDEEGLTNYLVAAGRGRGIGPAKARRLVREFGCDEVLEICRTLPRDVASVASVETWQAEEFAAKLVEQQATENATLEVDKLLTGRGFPKTLGRRCIKEWGNRAAEVITNDPYCLMNFRGVGFALADKLYIELGKDPVAVDRQALCLWYGLASDTEGHTWFPATEAVNRLQRNIGCAGVDYRAAIIRGREFGQIDENHYGAIASLRTAGDGGPIRESGDTLWLAEGKHANAEESLADYIVTANRESEAGHFAVWTDQQHEERIVLEHARCHRCHRALTARDVHILDGKPYGPTCIEYVAASGQAVGVMLLEEWLNENPITRQWTEEERSGWIETPEFSLWPEIDAIEKIDEHQRRVLGEALAGRVAILGGSPGTGKTFTVSQLVRALVASGRVGMDEIGIAAPTGKACVRLTELLREAGIDRVARTWHSLLGVDKQEGGGWTFRHGPDCPLPFKVLIGDESSMVDLSLMKSIFAARRAGCHVLLVGDVNQLPPVGKGAPLRDMIAAGISYGELTEIKRNSGGIVEACAAIRDEEPWAELTEAEETNLQHLPAPKSDYFEAVRDSILEVKQQGLDPVWDCQVLVAVNERSELSRQKANEFLQDALNPNPKQGKFPFRVADKIVCLKNGFYESVMDVDYQDEELQTNDRGEVYVANGELGNVLKIADEKAIVVRLENPNRVIRVPVFGKKSGDEGDSSGSGCHWQLGYALSVHKSQGSEWPVVFVILDDYPGARRICDRAWIYTAISRAKQRCVLVGNLNLAERFCRVQKMASRKTFLKETIRLKEFEKELVEL